MKVLELFSGIGGMHYALKGSKVEHSEVLLSVDINPTANAIYNYNFPEVKLMNRNIQSLSVEYINKLGADTILMSPPCQPFTRNGLKGDTNDARTIPFIYILNILPELNSIKNILIENVKGFEVSNMRNLLIEKLEKCNFNFQEFLICPSQLAVPNSRLRYYCIAKRLPEPFNFEIGPLLYNLPEQKDTEPTTCIKNYLENCDTDKYLVPMEILRKYWKIMDVCFEDSKRSCCFTKAYGRYAEGTGSVLTPLPKETYKVIRENIIKQSEFEHLLSSLQLRYFTPKEISKLQCFPETFNFPDKISDRQKYMVLGNSINVKVVSKLINLLA